MPIASDSIAWGLLLAALLDSADLYFRLIRRRASQRRMVSEQDDAVLRSLVRVLLVDD